MAAIGWAQAPGGAITGTVIDPTGAVVAGVTVTVTIQAPIPSVW